MLVFLMLTLMMKHTDTEETGVPREVQDKQLCGICQEEFLEDDLIMRKVGDGGYTRWFCDRCVIELYEESRMLHDPRTKDSINDPT